MTETKRHAPNVDALIEAALSVDWEQVALIRMYGEPCFHFEAERRRFCLRAETWFGHDGDPHYYISLAELLQETSENERRAISNACVDEIENAIKLVNAEMQTHAVSRDRAQEAGREMVASHRQSDVETCERIIARLKDRMLAVRSN